jgi:hypothetical protein
MQFMKNNVCFVLCVYLGSLVGLQTFTVNKESCL